MVHIFHHAMIRRFKLNSSISFPGWEFTDITLRAVFTKHYQRCYCVTLNDFDLLTCAEMRKDPRLRLRDS